jgi:DNA invertase Pin-like site-specific DNA recombinase
MYRACIVAAVSTPQQAAADRESIPEQLDECRRACREHAWPVHTEIVIPGHSREYWSLDDLTADCPEYADLVSLIESEAVNLVVCMRLARLCRTVPLLTQLMDLCAQHQCQLYAVREPQEPVPPERVRRRRGVTGILNLVSMAVSEEEQQVRVERMTQGMTRRVKAGLPAHSRHGQYGYDAPLLASQLPTVNEEQARWVRWMFERRARGWGYDRIAHELRLRGVPSPRGGVWYGPSVLHVLSNPLYKGTAKWGAVSNAAGQWEAIVSVDLWERANAVPRGSRQLHVHTLSGLVRCGYCGYAMVYGSNSKPQYSLRCNLYHKSRKLQCRPNYHAAGRVERYVLAYVREVLSDPERYLAVIATQRDQVDVSALTANLERLSRARAKWDHEYERDEISRAEWQGHRARIAEQMRGIEHVLREEEQAAARREEARDHAASLSDVLGHMDDLSRPEQNELLRLIVARVELRREEEPHIYLL